MGMKRTESSRRSLWGLGLAVAAVSAGVIGFALAGGSARGSAVPAAVELPARVAASPTSTSIVSPSTTVVAGAGSQSPLSEVVAPKPVVTRVGGLTATTIPSVTTTTTEAESETGHQTTSTTTVPVEGSTTTTPDDR